jgi:NhaP-type Na+/H+ or K+/H+ antiporter
MSESTGVQVVAAGFATFACWSVVSTRLARWNITAPMAFVAAGLVLANPPVDAIHVSISSEGVRTVAEIALAVVLFSDASTVRVGALRRDYGLPGRLLLVGLPLTIALGTLVAHVLVPHTSWWVSAVIGSAVAPTDAALGAAIISDRDVPLRLRRVLNVESGLNDGIATPFVKYFLAAAVAGTALATSSRFHPLEELAIGIAMGVLIGGVGGWAMTASRVRGLSSTASRNVGVAALSVVAYSLVVAIDGNGFVAAFVAGLAYSASTSAVHGEVERDFVEDVGEVLSGVVWFLFGTLAVATLKHTTWRDLVFAVLALTFVRMVPVALSLIGSRLDRATVTLLGWFGPRGLATVVFGLLAVDTLPPADGQRVLTVIAVTVLLSVVLHGVTAAPLGRRFARTHPATGASNAEAGGG